MSSDEVSEDIAKLSFDEIYELAAKQREAQNRKLVKDSIQNEVKVYYIGITQDKSNEPYSFRSGCAILPKNQIYHERHQVTKAESKVIEAKIFADYLAGHPFCKEESIAQSNEGQVIWHVDGDKMHRALMLGENGDKCYLLFSTTNDRWNHFSRLITKEERALLGFRDNKTSYFAPVLCFTKHVKFIGTSFPTHRVEALKAEFKVEMFK